MRVSFFETTYKKKPDSEYHINDVLSKIKFGDWKNEIEAIRKLKVKKDQDERKRKLPNFTASGTFSECADNSLIAHSGLIQIDIDEVNTAELREKLINDKYIYSLFVSPRGNGLKGIIKIPTVNHRDSFTALEKYFYDYYNVKIDPSCKNVSRRFYVSYDPDLYLNEHSEVFSEVSEAVNQKKSFQTGEINRDDFRSAIQAIRPKQTDDGQRDFYNKMIWAVNTVLGESEAVSFGKSVLANSRQLNDLDSIIKSQKGNTDHPEFVFRIAESHGWTNPKKKKNSKVVDINDAKSKQTVDGNTALKTETKRTKSNNIEYQVREWFEYNNFKFHYNVITGMVNLKDGEKWKPVTDRMVNRFIEDLHDDNIMANHTAVNTVLKSDRQPDFDPIRNYFDRLKTDYDYEHTPHLKKFFEDITGKKADQNADSFDAMKTWFASGAGISIGEIEKVDQLYCLSFYNPQQGAGKTTLVRRLVPPELKKYMNETFTDYESKDAKLQLVDNFLLNFDELGQASKHDLKKLKPLITLKSVTERRPYASNAECLPRRALLTATFDDDNVFDDPAGNRRFITIETQKINWKEFQVNIDDVWGESLAVYKSGMYNKSIDMFNLDRNKDFEKSHPAVEAIDKLFHTDVPDNCKDSFSSTEIQAVIQEKMKLSLTTKAIGEGLRKLGIQKISKKINGTSVKRYRIALKTL